MNLYHFIGGHANGRQFEVADRSDTYIATTARQSPSNPLEQNLIRETYTKRRLVADGQLIEYFALQKWSDADVFRTLMNINAGVTKLQEQKPVI